MIVRLFRRRSGRRLVDRLHGDIVAAARQTAFYAQCGVPDTLDGRFEMLVLHVSAVVRRLQGLPDPGPAMAQELTDSMFGHLDIALRETGVSDIAVPKRMKKLAGVYFGRAEAYGAALVQPTDEALVAALQRNIYGGTDAPEDGGARRLARYARALEAGLSQTSEAHLLAGEIAFPQGAEIERGQS